MGVEVITADDFLHDLFTSDATLQNLVEGRVYVDLARDVLPAIVFSMTSPGVDSMGVGGVRIMANPSYTVKAIGAGGSYAPLQPIADRIDALLHGEHNALKLGGIVFTAVRESPVHYTTVEGGVQYRHLGGLYRLAVQAQ